MHVAYKLRRDVRLFDRDVIRTLKVLKISKTYHDTVCFCDRRVEFVYTLQTAQILGNYHDIIVHAGIVYDLKYILFKVHIVRMALKLDLYMHAVFFCKEKNFGKCRNNNVLIVARHP